MEIYLAVVETYLALAFTFFFIFIGRNDTEKEKWKLDNEKWKNEVRSNFRKLNK